MKTTNEYMIDWRITINWEKTNYIVIGKPKIKISEIIIDSHKIEKVNEIKILRIYI